MNVFAKAVSASQNSKLGPGRASATLAAQASCPTSCPFFGNGCYAERGSLYAFHTSKLNAAALGRERLEVAHAEAVAIDKMVTVVGRPLRLHVVGDCADDASAKVVSAAAERFMTRGGGPAWSYTHAWRDVDRTSWGDVSILASCETAADVQEAHARGYATSLVVPELRDRRRYDHDGVDLLPCPEMTGASPSCVDCGLCFNDRRLLDERITIGFAVHGDATTRKRANATLEAVQE